MGTCVAAGVCCRTNRIAQLACAGVSARVAVGEDCTDMSYTRMEIHAERRRRSSYLQADEADCMERKVIHPSPRGFAAFGGQRPLGQVA
jgi:hypothetical protein